MATVDELVRVAGIVTRNGHEEPPGVLDAVGRDRPKDAILVHAFLRRWRIFDRVAATRVKEAVEASGRPLGEVLTLDENGVEAAHRRVARDPRAGSAAADNQYLGVDAVHPFGFSIAPKGLARLRRAAPSGRRAGADGSGRQAPLCLVLRFGPRPGR